MGNNCLAGEVSIANKEKHYTEILKERLSEILRGESQDVTCHRINSSQSNISKWKNGNAVPPVDVLVRISKTYNVSIDWLLGFSDRKTIDAIKYDDLTYEHVARIFDYLLETGTIAILEQSSKTDITDVEVDNCFDSDEDLEEQAIDHEKEQPILRDPNCIEIKDRAVSFILRQRYKMKELDDAYYNTWKEQAGLYSKQKLLNYNDERIVYAIDSRNWALISKNGDWVSLLKAVSQLTNEQLDEQMNKREKK